MSAPELVAVAREHAGVLAALHARCFDDAWDEAALASLLALPTTVGYIAGTRPPRGFVLCSTVADEGEILTLCVDPAARRRGVARTLVEAVLAQLGRLGCRRLFLEVAADNEAARELYRGLGFHEIGRRRDYYGRGRDALLLARDMPGGGQ